MLRRISGHPQVHNLFFFNRVRKKYRSCEGLTYSLFLSKFQKQTVDLRMT